MLILVRSWHSRIGGGEGMRVYFPVDRPGIRRLDIGHVAVGALLRFWRIVKRTCSESGDTAGLPGIVLVETTNPAIVVHRDVEMDFMTARAKFRCLRPHKGLQEYSAVRFRIQFDYEVMQQAKRRILRGGHFVKFGILQEEVSLSHAALHTGNRVAHHATKARASFRTVHDLLDGSVKQSAIEKSRVMAACTPFRGLHSLNVLHILDAAAIPLIIER